MLFFWCYHQLFVASFSLVQREVDSDDLGIVFTIAVLFISLGTAIFTIILRLDYEFNYQFVGLAVIILSLIFLMLLPSKGSPNPCSVKLHLTLFPTLKDSPNLSSHAGMSYKGSGNFYNREIKLTK
ncbi:Uncharacterised protein [Streptococcus pasteurianus]|nr:Uncharacterised protein [Streptococcus pasteurianus]